jgi:hypothetical protein
MLIAGSRTSSTSCRPDPFESITSTSGLVWLVRTMPLACGHCEQRYIMRHHRLARCSKSNLSFRRRLRDDGVTILHRVVIGWCWHARCRVPVALSCGLVHHFDEAAIDGRKAEACRWRVRANRHATYHREKRRASHWRSSIHERSRCYHVTMGDGGCKRANELGTFREGHSF